MSEVGVDALVSRIENIISIHISAEDVTNAEAIGVLEMIKLDIYQGTLESEDDG